MALTFTTFTGQRVPKQVSLMILVLSIQTLTTGHLTLTHKQWKRWGKNLCMSADLLFNKTNLAFQVITPSIMSQTISK